MKDEEDTRGLDLRRVALATTVAVGVIGTAGLIYQLIDILVLVFLGVVVAAALQPWHVRLCAWGVPKGPAVLIIYLFFCAAIVWLGGLIGPLLIDEVAAFGAEIPQTYENARASLRGSAIAPLRLAGAGMPAFDRLAQTATEFSPQLYEGMVGATTGVIAVFGYFFAVLAIGFYWTLEVPRFERLVLSLVPVERRAHALNVWHEIEFKLGAFMRAQGLAMFAIGVASAIGYLLIGLPNAIALAVIAGLFEAVPMIGPTLAAVPAVLVAIPLGLETVLLVVGFAALLQLFENYVLIPRIMDRVVGVSALVGTVAVLAFGSLYGIVGVFIAIPMAAAIQVLLERLVIDPEPPAAVPEIVGKPWAALRARARALRQKARLRLRGRESRMGIDPQTTDHVVDAIDHQIEEALMRVEKMIAIARKSSQPLSAAERAAILRRLEHATEEIEQAASRVDAVTTPEEATPNTVELPLAELNQATNQVDQAAQKVEGVIAETTAEPPPKVETITSDLERATQQMKGAVEDIDALVIAAAEKAGGSGRDRE